MSEHKSEHPHHTKKHSDETDAKTRAEGELKLKGLTPMPEPGDFVPFTTLSIDDQKFIHEHNAAGFQKLHEDLRKLKHEATDKKAAMEKEKQEHELKLLNVKRWEQDEHDKPEFICVVNGCGEEKAPGQGFHCPAHSKSK